MANSSAPAIEVSDLVVRYDPAGPAAVDGVTMQVHPGEVVALLGPNGAGKTTLLETIEGYRTPEAGEVSVLGHNPRRERHAVACRWGVMPQQTGFPMGVTVHEAISLFAGLQGASERVQSVLETAGLESLAKTRWRKLSGGEQQRLSLALALCGGTEVLLLDEPTNAVDADGRERILDLITQRATLGTAVLITTHRFDDVERIADRVVVLDGGRAIVQGSLDELTATEDRVEFRSNPALPTTELAERVGAAVTETHAGSYRVDAPPTPAIVATINEWLHEHDTMATSMLAGRRSLESVFLDLTRDASNDDQTSATGPSQASGRDA